MIVTEACMLVLFVYAESDYRTHFETIDRVKGIFSLANDRGYISAGIKYY